MSASIAFDESQIWWARRTYFKDLMKRAMRYSEDDPVTCDLLAFAGITGSLELDRYDRSTRSKLVRAVEAAAREVLEELRSSPASLPGDIEGIQRLIGLTGAG